MGRALTGRISSLFCLPAALKMTPSSSELPFATRAVR